MPERGCAVLSKHSAEITDTRKVKRDIPPENLLARSRAEPADAGFAAAGAFVDIHFTRAAGPRRIPGRLSDQGARKQAGCNTRLGQRRGDWRPIINRAEPVLRDSDSRSECGLIRLPRLQGDAPLSWRPLSPRQWCHSPRRSAVRETGAADVASPLGRRAEGEPARLRHRGQRRPAAASTWASTLMSPLSANSSTRRSRAIV